ncbi:hypothetical protein MCU_01358 [Bartonella elizabethae Re6043vi]|uniref:Uncharacterized protein n=1 Tax=Bartonella elizabethae Re6043vi TaxID=1094554 RepID=A0ABP2QMI7_BAREL|nr:hypothetical protein MCU_01358 [Bartonella elizabethae Re6043vi]
MDTLSTNQLNKKEKNSVSKIRRVFSIVRKILSTILKICLFFLFLFLLFIRKPVIILTEFIVGGSLLVLFIFLLDMWRVRLPMNTKQQWSLVI